MVLLIVDRFNYAIENSLYRCRHHFWGWDLEKERWPLCKTATFVLFSRLLVHTKKPNSQRGDLLESNESIWTSQWVVFLFLPTELGPHYGRWGNFRWTDNIVNWFIRLLLSEKRNRIDEIAYIGCNKSFRHHLDIQIQFYLKTSTTRIVFDDFVEIRLRQGYIAVSVATLFQRNLKITIAFDFEHSDC